jgi:glutathione S-transferase
MSYRLHYFSIRGRGEQIRLLFAALGVPYENVAVTGERFGEMRADGPSSLVFGALPMLEDGELRLVQGPVIMAFIGRAHGAAPSDPKAAALAESITLGAEDLRMKYFGLFGDTAADKQKEFLEGAWTARWLPAFEYLLERNGSSEHFVGAELTFADAAVWDVLNAMVTYIAGASLNSAPRVKAFYDSFAARPAVAKYLSERPAG